MADTDSGEKVMSDLMRHSLDFVSRKDRKPVAGALKNIYRVRRRRRRSGTRRLRGRYLGAPLSGHRPELASRLERGRALLRLSF